MHQNQEVVTNVNLAQILLPPCPHQIHSQRFPLKRWQYFGGVAKAESRENHRYRLVDQQLAPFTFYLHTKIII